MRIRRKRGLRFPRTNGQPRRVICGVRRSGTTVVMTYQLRSILTAYTCAKPPSTNNSVPVM